MQKYGFIRVAAAIPDVRIGNPKYNAARIKDMIVNAKNMGAQIVVFPELSMTGYSCGDLFFQIRLLNEARFQLECLISDTSDLNIISIVGLPIKIESRLFNCGVVFYKGKILGVVPKTSIRSSDGYMEERWFSSSSELISNYIRIAEQEVPIGSDLLFFNAYNCSLCFGLEISEDLFSLIPPSIYYANFGAKIIFNLSAFYAKAGSYEELSGLIKGHSLKCNAAYVYASAGIGESTTDGVFCGCGIIAENGVIIKKTKKFLTNECVICADIDYESLAIARIKNNNFSKSKSQNIANTSPETWIGSKKYRRVCFSLKSDDSKLSLSKLERQVNPYPFVPADKSTQEEILNEILQIQVLGLSKRILHTKSPHAFIGVSGGMDSAFALLAVVKTFDEIGFPRENIIGVIMPGFGTTKNSYENAAELMKSLKITIREIDIRPACLQHFKDIGHDINVHDTTFENVQARERYQILMDLANKEGGLVIGTGDLSEIALGWCTYNGDHMSMYNVNCGIPKTLIKYMLHWVADNAENEKMKEVLLKIAGAPITPELLPPGSSDEVGHRTEDIIGPYELHDFFLYHMLSYGSSPEKILFLAEQAFEGKYSKEVLKKWLRVFYQRFFSQQFKRSCMPDGPKVLELSLSPRGGWIMPSDAEAETWLKQIDGE